MNAVVIPGNHLIVKDKHYLKNSQDFIDFVGTIPNSIRELCEKANEYLELKSSEYRPATLSLLRVGLKKTILNSLGDRQFNSVYREALDSAFRAHVPVVKAEKFVHESKYLKRYEVEKLINECTERIGLIVEFLFYTGCRISEALNLRLSDCTPSGKMVSLRILGKGKKERTLNIPVMLYTRLNEFYKGNIYLFETRNHKKWNQAALYRELKRQSINVLGRPVHPHMLRHSLCTYLLNERNISIAQVSKMLGHANIKITVDMYHHGQPEFNQLFDDEGNFK